MLLDRPPPPQPEKAGRGATGEDTWLFPVPAPHSPIKMRICFLPKRREKSEEMVRPIAVVALDGQKEGSGAPSGLHGSQPSGRRRKR